MRRTSTFIVYLIVLLSPLLTSEVLLGSAITIEIDGLSYSDPNDSLAKADLILYRSMCEGDEPVMFDGRALDPGWNRFVYEGKGGKDSLVFVELEVFPGFSPHFNVTESCSQSSYQSTGIISVAFVEGGLPPYSYAIHQANVFSLHGKFEGLASGEYHLFVQDANGCIEERLVVVPEKEPIEVRNDAFILPCGVDSMKISLDFNAPDQDLEYKWMDGSSSSEFVVTEPGIYWVELSNKCEERFQEILVAQGNINLESPIYIPNAFSPNNDSYNDEYKVYPASGINILNFSIEVFDRTGSRVFASVDPAQGWDGTLDGQPMEEGVYLWRMWAEINGCRRNISLVEEGDITLVR